MEIEKLTDKLLENNFKQVTRTKIFKKELFSLCDDRGYRIFEDNRRLIVVKKCEIHSELEEDFQKDLAALHQIYQNIDLKYKSNFYFFVALEYTVKSDDELFINKFEKNELVCKKNIFKDDSDFERIPFFEYDLNHNDNNGKSQIYLEILKENIAEEKYNGDLELIWHAFQAGTSSESLLNKLMK